MLEFSEIKDVVGAEQRRLAAENPDVAASLRQLVFGFNRQFAAAEIREVSDLFDLCTMVDRDLRVPDGISEIVQAARAKILHALIEKFYLKKQTTEAFANLDKSAQITKERSLANLAARLIVVIRKEKPETFNQQWIRANAEDIFDNLKPLITDEETGVLDWERLRAVLPKDLRERFVIDMTALGQDALVKAISEYGDLVKQLGPEAVAQFLISIGKVKIDDFERVVRIISEHLGRCRVIKPNFDDVAGYPEALLRLTDVRKLIFLELRNYVYRELVKDDYDFRPVESHKARLGKVRKDVERALKAKVGTLTGEHAKLFQEVIAYFDAVLAIPTPERMVASLKEKPSERASFFPSLRQRIAMHELKEGRRKLISFFMGKGKTAAVFLAKEHISAKKMLYVCPPGKLVSEIEARVAKYYKPGQQPTVGVIRSGMTADALSEAMSKEVVIFPYSMMSSSVDGTRIVDEIKRYPFDFCVIDEVHWARKDEGRNTAAVYELASQIPGLYEEGTIALMSGDPTPNTPNDIVPQLRLYDRDTYGDVGSFRAAMKHVHPLGIRNALLDFMLLIDEPEDWEQYLNDRDGNAALYSQERTLYDSILENDNLDPSEKLYLLRLCALNPSLFDAVNHDVDSAVLDRVVDKVEEYLEGHNAVVILEHAFTHGIFTRHERFQGKSFAERLQERLGSSVDLRLIYGDISEAERADAIEASRRTDRKTVILAYSPIIREGINLSHIHRVISLGDEYNKPDLAQDVKRYAREGNTDVECLMVRPENTVYVGVCEHSEAKYDVTEALKHGGTFTENDLSLLEGGDMASNIRFRNGRIYIGTAIMDHLMSDHEKLNRIFSYLHGRGAEGPHGYKLFLEEYGRFFAELYIRNWESSYSANNARCVAGLFQELESGGHINSGAYADLACGPLVLDMTLGALDDGKSRKITSLDLNGDMLEQGKRALAGRRRGYKPDLRVGSISDMKALKKPLCDEGYDAINCALALEYTRLNPRVQRVERDERVSALLEFNRVLKTGGVAVITMPRNACTLEQFEALTTQLEAHFGFEILKDYTGRAQSLDNDSDHTFENFTIVARKVKEPALDGLNLNNLMLSRVQRKVATSGKPKKTDPPKPENKCQIHTKFRINSQDLEFGTSSDPADEQKRRERRVDETRTFLREVYHANGNSFENLSEEVIAEINRRGVVVVNYGSGSLFHFKGETITRSYSVT